MYRYVRILLILLCALPAAASVSAGSQQELIEDASQHHRFDPELRPLAQLIGEGEHVEALFLGREMAAEWAGDPPFDYLFGMAALGAGAYNEAAFAFERILILNPEHHRARLELARAHYRSNNWASARRHFEIARESDPPDAVVERINLYLDAIERAEQQTRRATTLTGRAGFGYDSNVNSGTDAETYEVGDEFLALFFPDEVEVPGESQKNSDPFFRLGLDLSHSEPLSRRDSLSGMIGVSRKDNLNEDDFDLSDVRIGGGYQHRRGDNLWRANLRFRQYWRDNDRLVQFYTGTGQWQRQHSPGFLYSVFTSVGTIRHPGSHQRDRDQSLLGASGIWLQSALRHSLSGYLGHEPARDSDFDQFSRDHLSLRGETSWRVAPGSNLTAKFLILATEYGERSQLFDETRRDRLWELGLGWQFQATSRLAVTAEVSHRDSDSSIDIFSYDRTLAEVGLRYAFF